MSNGPRLVLRIIAFHIKFFLSALEVERWETLVSLYRPIWKDVYIYICVYIMHTVGLSAKNLTASNDPLVCLLLAR